LRTLPQRRKSNELASLALVVWDVAEGVAAAAGEAQQVAAGLVEDVVDDRIVVGFDQSIKRGDRHVIQNFSSEITDISLSFVQPSPHKFLLISLY